MKSGVTAIVKGGLGNQLFVYAAARAFALRTNRSLWLDNRSAFSHDNYGRLYRLNRFPIAGEISPLGALPWRDLKDLRHKFFRSFNKLLPLAWRNYLAEKRDFGPAQLVKIVPRRAAVVLNGYWQSSICFSDFSDQIRRELQPPMPVNPSVEEWGKQLGYEESVFVHVRRNRYNPRLASQYYLDALAAAKEALSDPVFYLFGDDNAWGLDILNRAGVKAQVLTCDAPDELTDFWLMSRCRHAIIANSSFSWWAAWLIDHQGTRIWSPATPGWPVRMEESWTKIENTLEYS